MAELTPKRDGVVVIRPPAAGEAAVLVAGRDEEFHRFMGSGWDEPSPTACITVDGGVVGWVDFDTDRPWLAPGEVNIGYNLFASARGRGYASRAVKLLLHHLAVTSGHHTATLLIRHDNQRSLALARRTGFVLSGTVNGDAYWRRPVPPLHYSDGTVTIRRRHPDDLDADLEAKDHEQMRWLWSPSQVEAWEEMTPCRQRTHARAGLQASHDSFGSGPKWSFTVDAAGARGVGYVDCDLANQHVPAGEANIAYASHPSHRGRGYISAAVRLITRFLADHTAAKVAHIITDQNNTPSLRVARALGAMPTEAWTEQLGNTMVRHTLPISSETHLSSALAPGATARTHAG